MLFRVSKDLKGSLCLPSLKRTVLIAQRRVDIPEDVLFKPDIKSNINNGTLIPENDEFEKERYFNSGEVMIVNNTKNTMAIDSTRLAAGKARFFDKNVLSLPYIKKAEEDGDISIVRSPGKNKNSKKAVIGEEKIDEKDLADLEEIEDEEVEEITEEEEEDNEEIIEEKSEKIEEIKDNDEVETINKNEELEKQEENPKSIVWNFNNKKAEPAQKIGNPEIVNIDEDKNEENKKDISENKENNIKTGKRRGRKPSGAKKIEPVGEERPKDVSSADSDLDDRGLPKDKISEKLDEILNIIDDQSSKSDDKENFNFVDKQQELERIRRRIKK